MSPRKVSVSIVNYNGRDFLGDCLRSVMEQSYPEIEVVVVDNKSTDGSAGFVRENFPAVRVIENSENSYFCKGQNTGIRNSDGEYVLALNSDVVLHGEFVREAVRAAEADERIGSVSGRILRTGGGRLDTTGLFLGRDRRPVERGYGAADTGQFSEPGYVFGAGGVAPLYRRAMLEDVSLEGEYFDESYRAFYEDLDLAWRANRRGWLAYYAPAAVAWHQRGGTAKTNRPPLSLFASYNFAYLSDEMKARLMMNRYMTMLKNDRPKDTLINFPFIMAYDMKVWAYVALFSPRAIPIFLRNMKDLRRAWRRRGLITWKSRDS
jgi:GT2 family glycosyltransferase